MTRINLIDPKILADQHAMAEWREIVRIPTLLRQNLQKKSVRELLDGIPHSYTMGEGHVKFFLNKMLFLRNRHISLTEELHNRGYNLKEEKGSDEIFMHGLDQCLTSDYAPDKIAIQKNVDRILARIEEKESFYTFFREKIPTGFFRAIYKDLV